MDRRNFLKGSSAIALAGSATVAAAQAAKAADGKDAAAALSAPGILPQRRTLRMVSLWPDSVSGPADHIHRLIRRIEAATDRHWMIDISDMPANGAEAFNAVMTGKADLYAGHEHAHRTLHPAFSYLAGLPCRTGMDIGHLDAWLTAAGGQDLWDELAGEFNMKGLLIGHSGMAHGLFTRTPVRTRADLIGKRIATTGLAAEVLQAVDARPLDGTASTLAELIGDISIDGIELHGPPFDMPYGPSSARLNSAFTQQFLPGLDDAGYAITLGLRRSLWDGLATSERIMLSALASEALAASRADALAQARAFDQLNDTANRTGADKHPPHWIALADELSRIAASIVADLSGHDTHAARINASYMAFNGHPHVPAPHLSANV